MAIDPGQERKLQEEEAKLSATWLNGFSLAFMIVGVVQPVVAGAFSRWSPILMLAGVVLHLFARFWLRRGYPLE
jgi:hypothetical protein